MASKVFDRLRKQVKPENKQFIEKNLAICKQIRHILANHATINSQKALAEALQKEPSEISKWLSGFHNIGLENITRMEAILGKDIILTDEQAKEKYSGSSNENYKIFRTVRLKEEILVIPHLNYSINKVKRFTSRTEKLKPDRKKDQELFGFA
jgi:transcriptional regulator with XRE-family HTH domain